MLVGGRTRHCRPTQRFTALPASASLPTLLSQPTDGRALRFRPDMQESPGLDPEHLAVACEFTLAPLPATESDVFSDGVECRVWLADADGKKWTVANRFPACLLLDELAVAQQRRKWYYYSPSDAPLVSPLVEGARWATDSREVLAIPIGEEDFFVQLKHCRLVFDVAASPEDRVSGARLRAQLREGVSYEGLDALRRVEHPDWLPSISFEIVGGLERLMCLGGALKKDSGTWEAPPLPAPLVFAPTEEEGDPQPGVHVS